MPVTQWHQQNLPQRSVPRFAARHEDLLTAITEHPQWQGPANPSLYHVWDFVQRSNYMLSEYDNIKAGRPVEHPNQFKTGAGSGKEAAIFAFQDVCASTMMIDMMIGQGAPAPGAPRTDYGQRVRDAAKALSGACPQDQIMAGMMHD